MVGTSRQSGGFASIALALLLLFRLLIPSGYMIAADSGGKPGLALCAAPARAAAQAALHGSHDGHPDDPAPSRAGEIPCAFASLAAPPLPPAPPAVEARIPAVALPPALPAASDLRPVAPAASPPPARGPPRLV
ncbi:MAG TPA: hypothetical protein VF645_09210 [Allosphingosinicella sp.]|jgi:hypothetical protein